MCGLTADNMDSVAEDAAAVDTVTACFRLLFGAHTTSQHNFYLMKKPTRDSTNMHVLRLCDFAGTVPSTGWIRTNEVQPTCYPKFGRGNDTKIYERQ